VQPQRLLITGGAGFIGSALVRQAVAAGRQVLNVDKLTYAASLDAIREVEGAPNYSFLQADICDADAMRKAIAEFRPDSILHLAAESHVDRSIDGPAAFVQTNIVGSFVMLNEARRFWRGLDPDVASRFRFIQVSTDEVFGSLGASGLFDAASPYAPNSPYSASKASGDHLARAWHVTYGLPVIVTNCSNNYGPYQFPEKLIPLAIERALAGQPIPVYGDGLNVRDWLYVEDHARGLLAAATRGEAGQTYLFGGRSERTNLEVVRALCAALDELHPEGAPHERLEFVSDRPGHDRRYAIDPTHAEESLGWRAEHSFDAGIRRTVRWYLDHREWAHRVKESRYRGERLGTATV
jgi:dTDP-glucose 4,6-dehydratase